MQLQYYTAFIFIMSLKSAAENPKNTDILYHAILYVIIPFIYLHNKLSYMYKFQGA